MNKAVEDDPSAACASVTNGGVNGRFGVLSRPNRAWNVYLFPFMEYAKAFETIQLGDLLPRQTFGQPAWDRLVEIREKEYPEFRCPSGPAPRLNDPRVYDFRNGADDPPRRIVNATDQPDDNIDPLFPTCSYAAANNGANPSMGGPGATCNNHRGSFSYASRILIRDITDGTSNTILFGEKAYGRRVGPNRDIIVGGSSVIYTSAARVGDDAYSHGFTSARPGINVSDPSIQNCRDGLHSLHPGGAQVVLADGSVRFLSENIQVIDDAPHATNSISEFLFDRDDGFVIGEFAMPPAFPEYTPVGVVEVKRYPSYRVARTGTGGGMGRPFFTLFGHINREGISMTVPVEMRPESPESTGSMAFLYENGTQGETGVDAADPNVEVADVEPTTVLAVGLRGRRDDGRVASAETRLRAALAERAEEYEAAGPPRVTVYSGPGVPAAESFFEVQLPLRRADGAE